MEKYDYEAERLACEEQLNGVCEDPTHELCFTKEEFEQMFISKQKVKDAFMKFTSYQLTETDDSLRSVMMIDKDKFFQILKDLFGDKQRESIKEKGLVNYILSDEK